MCTVLLDLCARRSLTITGILCVCANMCAIIVCELRLRTTVRACGMRACVRAASTVLAFFTVWSVNASMQACLQEAVWRLSWASQSSNQTVGHFQSRLPSLYQKHTNTTHYYPLLDGFSRSSFAPENKVDIYYAYQRFNSEWSHYKWCFVLVNTYTISSSPHVS